MPEARGGCQWVVRGPRSKSIGAVEGEVVVCSRVALGKGGVVEKAEG